MLALLTLAIAADVVGVLSLGEPDPIADAVRADEVVVGVEAMLARTVRTPAPNARAVELVRQGEELLLAFEHARAAAALGEAAALLEPALSPVDVDTWTRARTLAGVAWMEAGNADAAKDAFTKLLALNPDVVPDASLLSPAARDQFNAARADITARGTGTLDVRTSADVIVDGRPRGKAPISIAGVVAGLHRVALVAPGFEPTVVDVNVVAGGVAQHDVALVPTASQRALAVDGNAPPRLADLRAVLVDAGLDALVIAERTGDTLRIRRVAKDSAPGAHVSVDPVDTLGARALAALAGPPSANVDFDAALLGRPRPVVAKAPAVVAPPDEGGDWLLYGAVGGALVVVAAATAATIALWPQPTPDRTVSVVLELPPP